MPLDGSRLGLPLPHTWGKPRLSRRGRRAGESQHGKEPPLPLVPCSHQWRGLADDLRRRSLGQARWMKRASCLEARAARGESTFGRPIWPRTGLALRWERGGQGRRRAARVWTSTWEGDVAREAGMATDGGSAKFPTACRNNKRETEAMTLAALLEEGFRGKIAIFSCSRVFT